MVLLTISCIVYSVPVQTDITLNQTSFANGVDVTIPCVVQGYPTPEIAWYKNKEKIEPNAKLMINGEYTRMQIIALLVIHSTADPGHGCGRNSKE